MQKNHKQMIVISMLLCMANSATAQAAASIGLPKLRHGLVVLSMLFYMVSPAKAQVSVNIGLPNLQIGINLPMFPELVPVPGYPVYYAPNMDANYFFYDGMYWVFRNDNWYASSWYNGPWGVVTPEFVPLFVLRIPVQYYRQPPPYFRGWRPNAPPRWGQHWGRNWEQGRRGWDKWKRSSAPAPAPLPMYQRQYAGDRYPHVEQQQPLRSRHYQYQPRDKTVRQQIQQQDRQHAPPRQREGSSDSGSQPGQRGPSLQGQQQRPDTVRPDNKSGHIRGGDWEAQETQQQGPKQGGKHGQGQRDDAERKPGR